VGTKTYPDARAMFRLAAKHDQLVFKPKPVMQKKLTPTRAYRIVVGLRGYNVDVVDFNPGIEPIVQRNKSLSRFQFAELEDAFAYVDTLKGK
jgi:hypothetical protein